MRALLLMVAACGFRGQDIASDGAPFQPIDAAHAIDSPVIIAIDAHQLADAELVDAKMPDAQMVDAMPQLTCPTTGGWMMLGTGHYYISPPSTLKHWWEAETDCESRGTAAGFLASHLAVIDDSTEATAVGAELGILTISYAWVGLFQPLGSPAKNANWTEITNVTTYVKWANGEPSDGTSVGSATEMGVENFGQMYPDATFNDTAGTDNLRYICECDGIAADPGAAAKVPPE